MITIEDIENKITDRTNIDKIHQAYLYAKKVHAGKKRLSGEDYISHPLEVTNILIDLNVDDKTIIAAILHEVINNGDKTKEEIEELFGEDIAKIVDSVSKLNKLELPDNSESSKVYLRKVLVGMSEDVRVLYIKLADRLHNMRTIWAVNPEKQVKKAHETMDVLVPIAHRLGINSIKSELENLCLFYLKRDIYDDIVNKLNNTVGELNDSLEEMKQDIIELLNDNNIKFEIKGRVKSVYSIYNKLNKGKKWNDIYDILALRVFVDKVSECYSVIGLIHSKFRPVQNRFKDYIAQPKENMYQSLHTTVFGNDGKVFEIQVRTYEMDEIAEKGIASHWSYKEKGTKKVQTIMEQKLEIYRNIIEANDKEISNLEKEIVSDMIYVYTPKGDVMELPKGSTPIDFAYRIHTRVGETTVGALVNHNIVPFTYELQDGDCVEIKTNPSSTPNKDWLNIVKTSQAVTKIKAYFSRKDHEEYVLKGKGILEKELRKRHLSFNDTFNEEAIDKLINILKFKDEDDIYLSIGTYRYTAGYLINLINEEKEEVTDILLDRKNHIKKQTNNYNDVIVDGYTNIQVSFAKCCKPVKGDEIIGTITNNQGIKIHKRTCKNISKNKDRLINVSWNDNSNTEYLTELYVYLKEPVDILSNIIETSTKDSVRINAFSSFVKNNTTIYQISIYVKNNEILENFSNHLLKIEHVINVSKELK